MPVTNPSGAVKAGTVAHFAASTAPAGWLKANGAAISRTAYAGLFAAIGTTYGAGNGSTTFNVPDLRGEFLRGLDDGRGADSGRAMGTWQDSQNRSHSHGVSDPGHSHSSGLTMMDDDNGGGVYGAVEGDNAFTTWWVGTTGSGTGIWINADGGNETRPRNVALLACIKF